MKIKICKFCSRYSKHNDKYIICKRTQSVRRVEDCNVSCRFFKPNWLYKIIPHWWWLM